MAQNRPLAGVGQPELGPALSAFVERSIGALTHVEDLSWSHAESAVWRVASASHQAVLKVHRQGRKFANELAAYTQWAPALRRELEERTYVPELLGVYAEHPRALLLSWEQGERAESLTLPVTEERALHLRAGRFLRALHELPVEPADALPLADAYRARLEAWVKRTSATVPTAVREAVAAEAVQALPFVQGCSRVPCHRDFTPRNWLVTSSGPSSTDTGRPELPSHALVVFDFEHSLPDLHLVDMQRLWVGLWRSRPDLKESFLAGYGRGLTAEEEHALRHISALWALSTVGWAREHADGEFEEAGWEVLRWLGLA